MSVFSDEALLTTFTTAILIFAGSTSSKYHGGTTHRGAHSGRGQEEDELSDVPAGVYIFRIAGLAGDFTTTLHTTSQAIKNAYTKSTFPWRSHDSARSPSQNH